MHTKYKKIFYKNTISSLIFFFIFFKKTQINLKYNFTANRVHLKILQVQILFFFENNNKLIALSIDRF